jgi:hypothetical protein
MARLALVIGLLLASGAAAQAPADPLAAVADADPAELARVAERIGDREVLDRLGAGRPAVVRLAAIRTTPWLRAPEAALPSLARIAGGRDSILAPAAALYAMRIATSLDTDAVAAREVLPSDLDGARTDLEALAADSTARPDLRRAAALAADALRALFGPGA